MSARAFRTNPSQLGRVILRRLFDASNHKPRPHLSFPEPSTTDDSCTENEPHEPTATIASPDSLAKPRSPWFMLRAAVKKADAPVNPLN